MTASAFREVSLGSLNFFLEIKGYNHRFLEIKINIPDSLTVLEKDIVNEIKKYVRRGYVFFSLKIIKDHENLYKLNKSLIMSLLEELEKITGKKESICDWKELLGNPYIFYLENKVFSMEDYEKIMREVKALLLEFSNVREQEGKSIHEAILKSLNTMEKILTSIKEEEEIWKKEVKNMIYKKIQEFDFNHISEDRLYQELAFLLMKTDINEELVRLEEFIRRFKEEMLKDIPIGKTLEFIVQEMNREINTLSSKTAKTSTMFYAVDIKNELEKIRELVLNVE